MSRVKEFAHLYVILVLRKWKQSLLFPYLTVCYFNGSIWKSLCSDRPQTRTSSDSASSEIPVLTLHYKYYVFTLAEKF